MIYSILSCSMWQFPKSLITILECWTLWWSSFYFNEEYPIIKYVFIICSIINWLHIIKILGSIRYSFKVLSILASAILLYIIQSCSANQISRNIQRRIIDTNTTVLWKPGSWDQTVPLPCSCITVWCTSTALECSMKAAYFTNCLKHLRMCTRFTTNNIW